MRFSSIKACFSVPTHTLRSAFSNNRNYNPPKKNHNPHFKFLSKSSMTTTQKPNEEGVAKRLWATFNKESILSLYTPFVVSLASGNLKLDTFRHYIAQDVHFLRSFAQAYEFAEEFADDDAAKSSISDLRQSVLEELKMHGSFCQRMARMVFELGYGYPIVCQRLLSCEDIGLDYSVEQMKEWGFDVSNETLPNSATLKYTEFLLAIASGKIEGIKSPSNLTPFEKTKVAAYTIGAMVPCMRLYAFIGKKLQSLVDVSVNPHPYKKWIDNYSCEAFQAAALQTENLLDKLGVTLTGEEVDIMQKFYHQAMKLETEFFLAQPIDQQTVVPLSKEHNCVTIFSDFDLTCTVVDSCTVLAEIAMDTSPKSGQIHPESQHQIKRMPLSKLRSTWEALSKQYAEEYQHLMESILVNQKVEKFDYEGLWKALEHLSDFEKRANTRVIDSEILKGLNFEDIKGAGQHLVLQDGCLDFFESAIKNENLNAKIHVLSYCWCGDLIRSAFSSGGIHNLQLHANELIYEDLQSTGQIFRKVESPIDKHQVFSDVLKECDKKNLTIYIGDSVGDLLCMVEADIGIVIGSSSSLRQVGAHFGVSFVPLYPSLVMKQREHVQGSAFSWNRRSGIVYTTSSWAEIHSFVVGA